MKDVVVNIQDGFQEMVACQDYQFKQTEATTLIHVLKAVCFQSNVQGFVTFSSI